MNNLLENVPGIFNQTEDDDWLQLGIQNENQCRRVFNRYQALDDLIHQDTQEVYRKSLPVRS